MGKQTGPAPQARSLADVLAEELDGKLGEEQSQDAPVVEKQARLKAIYDRIHKEEPERSALCLSGGGLRSAIFGLGVLQGLAQKGLLRGFDYLSTVSGGGYVGGWLTAWIKNHAQGASGVIDELRRPPASTLNPEPQPIRHLRAYSNYLTPKTGLTSVDTWTLIATFCRNMFLNWLVLISWLAAAMMVPRLYLTAITLQPNWAAADPANYPQVIQRWDLSLNVLLVVAFALIAGAMAYAIIDVPSTGNARFSQSRFLRYRQLPLFLAALILAEWWALFRNTHGRELFNSSELLFKFVVFSVTSYLAGGLLATGILSFRKDKGGDQRVVPSFLRLVTILLTTAFGGVCFWAIATHVFLTPAQHAVNYVCFAPALFLAVLLLINFLFTGLASWVSEDEDREWWGRSAAWILITIIGWIVVNMIVLWGAQVLTAQHDNQLGVFLGKVEANPAAKAVLAAFGGMTGVVGALLTLRSKVDTKVGGARASQWP